VPPPWIDVTYGSCNGERTIQMLFLYGASLTLLTIHLLQIKGVPRIAAVIAFAGLSRIPWTP
jgi:hypothetical protein